MAVSRCGQMVASGQVGTRNFKGNAAPVFVWDMAIEKRIVALRGLYDDVFVFQTVSLKYAHTQGSA